MPDVSMSTGGFLASPDQQAAGYGVLSATSLAFGAVAVLVPELLLSVAVGGDASTLEVAFTRIAGATMAISAATEYSLRVGVVALCEPQPSACPTGCCLCTQPTTANRLKLIDLQPPNAASLSSMSCSDTCASARRPLGGHCMLEHFVATHTSTHDCTRHV